MASLALGLGLAVVLGRFMEALLFGVATLNPEVFAGVAGVLAVAGLLAAWIPARRATTIDPAGAMSGRG